MGQLNVSIRFTIVVYFCFIGSLKAKAGGSEEEGPLKISTIVQAPYLMFYNETWRSGNDQFYGFIPDLLEALCKQGAFSCDYEISLVKDGRYGWRYGGQWNGIIGEVFYHDADIGAAPLMVSSFREQAVSFTVPISNNSLTILVQEDWPIFSRDDLLSLSPGWLKFGTLESGWSKNAFATARDVLGTSLWSLMKDFADDLSEGVRKTRTGNYSFISSRDELEYYSNYYCGLDIRDNFYGTDPNALVVRKNSELLQPINDGLKTLMDDGTFWRIRQKWWSPKCRVSDSGAARFNVPIIVVLISTLFTGFA